MSFRTANSQLDGEDKCLDTKDKIFAINNLPTKEFACIDLSQQQPL